MLAIGMKALNTGITGQDGFSVTGLTLPARGSGSSIEVVAVDIYWEENHGNYKGFSCRPGSEGKKCQ
jgi:hypothetical protein